MRDIRRDLQERLQDAKARKEKHQAGLRHAEAEEAHLIKMLDFENRRFDGTPAALPSPAYSNPFRLDDGGAARQFIEKLAPREKLFSLADLSQLAQSKGFTVKEGRSMKRVLNATLLGMRQQKLAERHGKLWMLPKAETSPVSTGEVSG